MLDVLLGASGGVFGILGALFKHGIEVWQAKQQADKEIALAQEDNRHEEVMADKQKELIQLEAQNGIALAEVNRAKETDVAAYAALGSSFDADKATYSDDKTSIWMVAVDFVRGMTRPGLTLMFSIALITFTVMIWGMLPKEVVITPDFLKSTFYRLVDALIFLATSAVGWWFAARPSGSAK
ncbi:MAG: hypothetical protein QFB87_05280 [Patescibacteria group bacterium]|nr:hypothetical protein [Patescibacteria group bacterium]